MSVGADYRLITDFWRFFRKYRDLREDDTYWDELTRAASEFVNAHDEDRFASELIMALVRELERRAK